MKYKQELTLIELLAVIAINALLLSIELPFFEESQRRCRGRSLPIESAPDGEDVKNVWPKLQWKISK